MAARLDDSRAEPFRAPRKRQWYRSTMIAQTPPWSAQQVLLIGGDKCYVCFHHAWLAPSFSTKRVDDSTAWPKVNQQQKTQEPTSSQSYVKRNHNLVPFLLPAPLHYITLRRLFACTVLGHRVLDGWLLPSYIQSLHLERTRCRWQTEACCCTKVRVAECWVKIIVTHPGHSTTPIPGSPIRLLCCLSFRSDQSTATYLHAIYIYI